MTHKCNVKYCDGTQLGHELASSFVKETEKFETRMSEMSRRLRHPDDYVKPKNLQVDDESRKP